MKRLMQTGDTIVEVLLAMAVMSLILGGAYSIANRSLIGGRQAQERGEALKFTEAQVEKVKTLAGTNYAQLQQATLYCLDDTLTNKNITGLSSFPPLASTNLGVYPAECINQNPDGTPGFYHYAIQYDSASSNDVFTVVTRWDRAGGGGFDEVRLIYKVHP
jgi:Tfp pilus assembly protein PilV